MIVLQMYIHTVLPFFKEERKIVLYVSQLIYQYPTSSATYN